MFRARHVLVLLGAAGAVLSCQLLLDLERPEGIPREAGADVERPDPCNHTLPPKPPETDDDPNTRLSMWFALRTAGMPVKLDGGAHPGVDLDDSCTCSPDKWDAAPPCRTPVKKAPVLCDYEGGVDDALGRLADRYASSVPNYDPNEPINEQLRDGKRGLLAYIRDWNGKANDPQIFISFVSSGGLYSNLGCDDQARDAGPPDFAGPPGSPPEGLYKPVWDGCDRWSPNIGFVQGKRPTNYPGQLFKGWVKDYTLVFPVDRVGFELFGNAAFVGSGYMVAKLTPTNSGNPNDQYHLDGVITGRMSFGDMVKAIGRTPVNKVVGEGREPFCYSPFWELASASLCEALDSMEVPSRDHTFLDGSAVACDAASATIAFTAQQAQVSDIAFTNASQGMGCEDIVLNCGN